MKLLHDPPNIYAITEFANYTCSKIQKYYFKNMLSANASLSSFKDRIHLKKNLNKILNNKKSKTPNHEFQTTKNYFAPHQFNTDQ